MNYTIVSSVLRVGILKCDSFKSINEPDICLFPILPKTRFGIADSQDNSLLGHSSYWYIIFCLHSIGCQRKYFLMEWLPYNRTIMSDPSDPAAVISLIFYDMLIPTYPRCRVDRCVVNLVCVVNLFIHQRGGLVGIIWLVFRYRRLTSMLLHMKFSIKK